MRKREGRERKEREKMREERKIVWLKQFESIKFFFFFNPIQLQYHLTIKMVL